MSENDQGYTEKKNFEAGTVVQVVKNEKEATREGEEK
jgi:hypothetical protein